MVLSPFWAEISTKVRHSHHLTPQETKISFAPISQLSLTASLSEECLLALPDSTAETNPDTGTLLQDLKQQFPGVWAETHPPGLAAHCPPVVVNLLAISTLLGVWKYPMNQKSGLPISRGC